DLAKTPVPIERNGDRDRRIVALEFHPTGDQQVVKLIDVKRRARFAKEQCAGLGDRAVAKAVADRFEMTLDRRNAPVLIYVGYRRFATISRFILVTLGLFHPRTARCV